MLIREAAFPLRRTVNLDRKVHGRNKGFRLVNIGELKVYGPGGRHEDEDQVVALRFGRARKENIQQKHSDDKQVGNRRMDSI